MTLKKYLTNKLNSTKFRVNGLIPSTHLPNKRQLCQSFHDHMIYRAEQLPPKVDLRSDMTPVEDQSHIGSCTANSLAGAYEYLTKKANGRDTDISRLFIYYNARVKDQKTNQVVDSGCTMTSAIESLSELGTCLESVWPYNISDVNKRPNDQAYQQGVQHRITSALRVDINLNEMKSCLAQGFPFAFGLKLYGSFDQASKTGVVPMPNYWENGRQAHGYHALLAVGYSDQSRAFIVRNSWGEQWGDRGYCYIPYDYLTNPGLCFDVWTVRQLATDDFGREHWDSDDNVDYTNNSEVRVLSSYYQSNGEIIDTDDDDDDNNNGYDGQKRNNQYQSWDQYQVYQGDTYSYTNDRYGYSSETYPNNNKFQNNQSYQNDNNYYGYGGGNYYDYNRSNNNSSNYYNDFYTSPSTFYQPQQYGSNYGYMNPFNYSF